MRITAASEPGAHPWRVQNVVDRAPGVAAKMPATAWTAGQKRRITAAAAERARDPCETGH